MDTLTSFEEYWSQSQAQISALWFIANIIFTGIEAFILKLVYVNFGNTLSNRNYFGKTFPLIAMTTMLIITIVKSSLALSLGLVGALSIIRFRAAIKEPEELAYLFIAISIGLGFGANQGVITTIALAMILALIVVTRKSSVIGDDSNNLYLTIQSDSPSDLSIDMIITILEQYCKKVDLKRLDESHQKLEGSFMVEFENHNQMLECKNELLKLNDNLVCTFLDNKKIY